jgi:hypothetical protein
MKRILTVAIGLLACTLGCVPRRDVPPGVRSLRQQHRQKTIAIPVWDIEVAEELAARAADYSGKTLLIGLAHLDPKAGLQVGKDFARFSLRGGGEVMAPAASLPAWLRNGTGAHCRQWAPPLKLQARVHPPRQGEDGQPAGPALRAERLDYAHPLELAFLKIEPAQDGTWLTASIENYRGEGARATLDVRFGNFRERSRIDAVAPGKSFDLRLKIAGPTLPRWSDFPPERRSLSLLCDDGTAVAVDLGKWLEGPPVSLLDWGYTFVPPGSVVLALSADSAASELERFAALELRSYLAHFTDANIEPREPDSKEALPAQPLLVVGTPKHNPLAAELVRAAGLDDRLRGLGEDGYLLKTLRHENRPTLLVTAATPRGLVYGVYGLLDHYGVRFTLTGARLPARSAFRVVDVDEAKAPVFARRRLVAAGPDPAWTSRWPQGQWLSMIDQAAKNRFNEAVMPLDGLETTFAYEPGRSQSAVFPFETGPYSCVAEAYLAHQRGLAIIADYARRRGVELIFARRSPEGKLCVAAPPACLEAKPPQALGQPIGVLEDPGDFLGLPRVEETAKVAADLLRSGGPAFAVPYRGGGSRAAFLARFAWDKELTPEAHYRRWAMGLCEGEAAEKFTKALLDFDRLDKDLLAALPRPFGLGTAIATPVEEADLACDWSRLRARATGEAVLAQVRDLKDQCQKLRDVQARLEPIHAALLEALGASRLLWEAPLSEVPATQRSERVAEGVYLFRALLGALASVQEGSLAYYAGLAEPADALPQLAAASGKYRKARRNLLWALGRARRAEMAPALASLAEKLLEQSARLAEWLGPAAEADPVTRLQLGGSEAIVHLFRTRTEDIYAAYRLAGDETVQLRLNTAEARVFRRGQPPKAVRAEGGLFLVSLGQTPTYVVARRAAWPGQPTP